MRDYMLPVVALAVLYAASALAFYAGQSAPQPCQVARVYTVSP